MKYQKGNFVVIPNKAKLKWKSPTLLAVYFRVCSFADEEWLCFPSLQTIADCAGCTSRVVIKYLKELEDLQLLLKVNRFRGNEKISNEYQIMTIEEGGSEPKSQPSELKSQGGSEPKSHRTISTSLTKSNKDRNPPPLLEEVQLYFKENWYKDDVAIRAYKFYDTADWHDSNWKKVLNRKQKMQSVWFKDETKVVLEKSKEKTEEVNKWKQEQIEKEQEAKKQYLASQSN